MKPRILLIEDDPAIRAGLEMNLKVEGYDIVTSVDGEEAMRRVLGERFELLLLDLTLPRIDGLEILRAARNHGITTPVIVLSARGHELDKVAALEMGADDYVSKPFGLAELLSRIRAVLRRGGSQSQNTWRFADVVIEPERREVRKNGEPVEMTAKEYDLLVFLVRNAERVFSREQLLDRVWDVGYQGTARTVDNFIAQLRAKLEIDSEHPRHFLTIRGVGYRFSPQGKA